MNGHMLVLMESHDLPAHQISLEVIWSIEKNYIFDSNMTKKAAVIQDSNPHLPQRFPESSLHNFDWGNVAQVLAYTGQWCDIFLLSLSPVLQL